MELRATREMRRNERLAKAAAKTADTEAPAKAPPARPQAPADKVTLSQQALAFLKEQNQRAWEQAQERERRRSRIDGYLGAMETSQKQLDSMGEKLKIQNKCQKIAASIMKGDRVPPEDLQYLMEHDPEGYKLAMAMRREKRDPEDCESVLNDEDRKAGSKEGAGDSGGTLDAAGTEGPCGGDAPAMAE